MPVAAPTVHAAEFIYETLDQTNLKRDVSEAIDFLSPIDVPMLTLIGQASLQSPCNQVKHEWMEDRLRPRDTTLLTAYTAGSGTLTVAADAGKYYSIDDLLLIGSNVLQILAGPPDSDTFVVTGGVGDNTTDADAAAGATVKKLGSALPEGSVSRTDTRKTQVVMPYNYTQILRDQTLLTGTMEVIERYGYVSERAYQEAKVLKRLAIDLEHEILYGVRSYITGPPRRSTMGGLFEYVLLAGIADTWTTVVDGASADLSEDTLNDVLQQIWEEGGQPTTLMVNGYNKRIITSWETPRIRTDRDESMGGASIGSYESEFGTVSIVMNRWLRASDAILFRPEDIGLGPLNGRAFASRVLPQTGDFTQTEILGEYTMEIHRASQQFGWIYDLATS